MRSAVNQLGPELILEGGDLFADGRLTDSPFLRDRGEAPFLNYSNENLHCIEFVHDTPPIPLSIHSIRARVALSVRIPSRNSRYSSDCQIYLQCWHINIPGD